MRGPRTDHVNKPAAALAKRPTQRLSVERHHPPWVRPATALIHSRKVSASATGSKIAKTRPSVSCDGILFGKSRNVFNHASLDSPNSSMATKESAPQITATSDRASMLVSGWCAGINRQKDEDERAFR